jgi:sodium transport system permease protein
VLEKIRIVAAKELADNLRDRRSTILSMVYPLIGPVLLGALVLFVGSMLTAPKVSEHVIVAKGSDRAPDFVDFVRAQGARVVETEVDDVAEAVRSGLYPAILVFPDGYKEAYEAQRNVEVQLIIDSSRLSSIMSIGRTVELINSFNTQVSHERLAAHDVDPEIAIPLTLKSTNVAASLSISGIFLNMMAPFLIFNVFIGGVYLAIDTTAGERERGSLEPLLINPVPRWQLMIGKYGASLAFTALAVIVALIAYKAIFSALGALGLGIRINPGIGAFALIFGITVPIMMLAVAVQIMVATVSRSFKETQTYLGLLPLLPSLPGMIMVFVPLQPTAWAMLIPTYGQTILIGQIVRGEHPDPLHIALACAATVAVTCGLLAWAARLYDREEIAFAH